MNDGKSPDSINEARGPAGNQCYHTKTLRPQLCDDEDYGEAAGAVDAFDAGQFNVGGGGGAGYCGDWGAGGRF